MYEGTKQDEEAVTPNTYIGGLFPKFYKSQVILQNFLMYFCYHFIDDFFLRVFIHLCYQQYSSLLSQQYSDSKLVGIFHFVRNTTLLVGLKLLLQPTSTGVPGLNNCATRLVTFMSRPFSKSKLFFT